MRQDALLAVLDRLMTATTPVSAHAEALRLLETLGAAQLNYVQLQRGPDSVTPQPISLLTNLSAQWQRLYEAEGMAAFDYTTRKVLMEASCRPLVLGPRLCDRYPDMTATERELVQEWPNLTGTNGAMSSRLADPVVGRITGAFVGFTSNSQDFMALMADRGQMFVLVIMALNERIVMLQSAADMDEDADEGPSGLQVPRARAADCPGIRLRDREREVLQGVIRGDGCARIADRLRLSEATVAAHLHNVRRRLGVRTNEQSAVKAILFGLIQP